jgi:hypothetical protein
MYPDWHGQVSASTLLPGPGRAWCLPSVLARFSIAQLDERNSVPNRSAADHLPALNRAGTQEIPDTC